MKQSTADKTVAITQSVSQCVYYRRDANDVESTTKGPRSFGTNVARHRQLGPVADSDAQTTRRRLYTLSLTSRAAVFDTSMTTRSPDATSRPVAPSATVNDDNLLPTPRASYAAWLCCICFSCLLIFLNSCCIVIYLVNIFPRQPPLLSCLYFVCFVITIILFYS